MPETVEPQRVLCKQFFALSPASGHIHLRHDRGMPPATPIEPVELHVGELLLRPWRADDADAYWAALQSPDGRLWHGSTLDTRDEVRSALARRSDWTTGDHASWALVDDAGLLGSFSVHRIDRDQDDGEIGYWTAPAARGRGLAARAVQTACRWAFGDLGLHRIQLFHAVDNVASGRVAEKAGFTYEGRLRQSHRYGDGLRHDELLWARLATD
jgi:RimJ/RimL family protein N-acetyltransferase